MREKILLVGEQNTSKTLSLITLAVACPQSKVVIFDPDDGTEKTRKEIESQIGEEIDNLIVEPVPLDWEKFIQTYNQYKTLLKSEDWLCLDMLGRFWDRAQEYYSTYVFGQNPTEHLMLLKKQAKSTAFGGFDGMTDWPLIKRLHNELLLDDLVLRSGFNVMCTTSTSFIAPVSKKLGNDTIEGIYQREFGIKPEGEKHNTYRFDTQAVLTREVESGITRYYFRIARDRGRSFDIKRKFDITGQGFWPVYKAYRELR